MLVAPYYFLVFFVPVTYCLTQQFPRTRDANNFYRRPSFTRQNRIVTYASEGDFVDVEFERSEPEEVDVYSDKISETADSDADLSALLGTSKNLIDISLDSGDPRWKETRIPFCRGTEFIDCKLAFMVDLEGQSYGIGVPFDDVVAIVVQENSDKKKNGNHESMATKNVSPDAYEDDEEYAELMEIFAGQVQEQLGEEFQLRKTPKVLTISGGLDKITKDWQNKVITKPFDVDELLEISKPKDEENLNKELDSFYKFMRDELGDEEFEKTMNGEDDDGVMGGEFSHLMDLFDVPEIDGTTEKDRDDIEKLVDSMTQDIERGEVSEANEFIPDTDNAALKLLGYTFRESGKSYFLVKPLQPYTLIGRHVKEDEDIIRFELLTPEEDKVIIPKLEEMCREDLQANGLTFPSMDAAV